MQPTDEIKSRLDLADFIQEYLPLKPSGGNYKGLCPFHSEKTPSFMVSKSKQIWHCFGCHEGGDIFSFVMKREGMEFIEALHLLANRAGVTLEQHERGVQTERARLQEICDLAAQYYQHCLQKGSFASKAREYLSSRHIAQHSIDVFRIGFSPPKNFRGADLNNLLLEKGFSEQEIVKTGLVIKSERGFGYFDRFRNRIIFPICDIHGRCVGFTSRILPGDDDGMGKYVNTPQTALYNKSEILYGMHLAKEGIRKKDRAVIVEGNMDVIASHEVGVSHVIACSGTALTHEQIQLIKRFTENVTFAFDMDEAGWNATQRAFETCLQEGLHVRILRMSKKSLIKDADELIRSMGSGENAKLAWENLITEAEPFLKILLQEVFQNIDLNDADQKRIASRKILNILAKLPDPIEQSHFLAELSGIIRVPVNILYEVITAGKKSQMITRLRQKDIKNAEKHQVYPKTRMQLLVEQIIGFLVQYPYLRHTIFDQIRPEFFLNGDAEALYKDIILYYTQEDTKYQKTEDSSSKDAFEDLRQFLSGKQKPQMIELLERCAIRGEEIFSHLSQEELIPEIMRQIYDLKKLVITVQVHSIQEKMQLVEKAILDEDARNATLNQLSAEFSNWMEQLHQLQ